MQVYNSAFRFQFREPDTADTQQKEGNEAQRESGGAGGAGDAGENVSSEAKESGPGLLELSKPSEFRLKALKQQKYLTFNKGSAATRSLCERFFCFFFLFCFFLPALE